MNKLEKLTPEQVNVLKKVVTKVKRGEPITTLGGYAGTGKTTMIRYLVKFFPDFAIGAYTGKASNILRKKGLSDAGTIHSQIYKPAIENGVLVGFDLNLDLRASGFIVDEASMISEEIFEDLQSFNIPIIYVGDHGQLEPVGSDFNLMQRPDFTLETIHRNAGDIAKFAEHIRKGFAAQSFRGTEGKVRFLNKWKMGINNMLGADQVICAFNKTRVNNNERMREVLGYQGLLNVGEKVICLKNNKDINLFNGMQGIVKKLKKSGKKNLMDFEFDGYTFRGIKYDERFFGVTKPEFRYHDKEGPNPFDYAYCITAHKSQGDEWDNVMVIEQKSKMWDHRRWAYTAASRAKENLAWVLN